MISQAKWIEWRFITSLPLGVLINKHVELETNEDNAKSNKHAGNDISYGYLW